MQLTITNQNALFSISNDQWIGLNRWIGDIITEGNLIYQQYSTGFPPSFPTAVACGQLWSTSTFLAIDQMASNVCNYSTSAIKNFSAILSAYNELAPNAEIPLELQNQTTDAITELCSKTSTLYSQFSPVMEALVAFQNSFIQVNSEWTANSNQYQTFCEFIMFCDYLPFPPGSSSGDIRDFLIDFFNQFVVIFQQFEGAWLALNNDLSAAASSPLSVTNSFLASLDLQNSIHDWTNLQSETSSFSVVLTEAQALWLNPDEQTPWQS
jgi:hypothetical protein